MADEQDIFRVRLNCVDHYQTAPSSLDALIWGPHAWSSTQRSDLPKVPVIRVFGATETGQKVCAHIHGAFPYLFVPYVGSIEKQDVDSYIATFRHSTDHALALSYRRNPYDNPRSATFVAHISLVKGTPFFGYNVGYKYYLKIYLLNPTHMTRFADLLQQGAILKEHFQPYEAHQQYLLQWMCDFNLYGCAFIETDKPYFRRPVPLKEDLADPSHRWHYQSITDEALLDEDKFPRQSHCQLELDIRVEDILNRASVQARPLHHSFVERLSTLEHLPPEEKLVHSMAGLWKDESRRRRLRMGLSDPSSSPFPPEVLVSMSADPRNTGDGGWIHEEEFRHAVAQLADHEKQSRDGNELTFESFLSQKQDDSQIQTVFESIEELFAPSLEKLWSAGSISGDGETSSFGLYSFGSDGPGNNANSMALVDEENINRVADEENYESDEDIARTEALARHQALGKTDLEHLQGAGVNEDVAKLEAMAGPADDFDALHDTLSDSNGRRLKRPQPIDSEFSSSQETVGKGREYVEESSPRTKRPRLIFKDKTPTNHKRAQSLQDKPKSNGSFETPPAAQPRELPSFEDDVANFPRHGQLPSSQRSSQGRQLSFPIVKAGTDSDVSFRLSQRDDLAHIPQKSFTTSLKNVTSSEDSDKTIVTNSSKTTVKSSRPLNPALITNYASTFGRSNASGVIVYSQMPPSHEEIATTVLPSVIYQDAYYSREKDVPERPREYAGQEFKLESNTLPFLPEFDRSGSQSRHVLDRLKADLALQRRKRHCTLRTWEIMRSPPTWSDVQSWLDSEATTAAPLDDADFEVDGPPTASQLKRKNRPAPELSQIEGPTQKNKHGFKYSQRKASTSVKHETGYMSTMSLELHVNSRADLAPDPERDEVSMVVWCIADEQMEETAKVGILVLSRDDDSAIVESIRKIVGDAVQVDAEDNELELINRMVDIVREYDPDILTGFEVHNNSWGYLIERARLHYEFNLPNEFSRMKSQSHGRFGKDADRWGFTHTSTLTITGRHTINIWRAMRSELNLLQYTMENVVFHLLHQRIPHYAFATLTRWYQSKHAKDLAKVLDYFITRTRLDLAILDANELIPRTSEQARLLGVDFFSVFSRGSQFKVESLMFRIAKPESFVLVSPSRKQVGAQNALECLPLVMEPQSAFYSSPLLVLDFQSLYPSVMIAYNYCYSTCLGRIVNWRGTNKLGFADFKRKPGLLELVKDKINISPNGLMYVKPEMRKSLLAKMLGEILETRVMVKSGMKVDKDDKTLQQLLNNRQLALKLIANVTYGYTSASFSGRMPCVEIADSIVQTGRETLEKAIAFIHSVERWGAEVVYGDTDSLFVYLKGRTRNEAFKIGEEISKAVTDMNPRPVKLKFEKVYHPCVLLAKKRYVGFKYESPNQTVPEFDAKGIETVRRDGTPAEQKIEEKALKTLFRTSDLSEVKRYFQSQCTKIMAGRVSVQDFCFAKEVKLGTYSDKGPPPPGALIATRRMLRDPRSEPQYGERVPYVVIAGAPGARLWERCVEPERLINDEHAELDAEYYISKNLIPPLERIFNLVGANVRQWYDEMPKLQRIRMLGGPRDGTAGIGKGKKTMESYMGSSLCLSCRAKLPPVTKDELEQALPLCHACRHERPSQTLLTLREKAYKAEKKAKDMMGVCRSCANLAWGEDVKCDSHDCPVFYSRVKAGTQLNVVRAGVGKVSTMLQEEMISREALEW